MTQFLFVRPEPASLPAGFFAEVAKTAPPVFDGDGGVWQIVTEEGELDSACDEARKILLGGGTIAQTRLGEVLQSLIEQRCELAMFWASDFEELPEPATAEELLRLVVDQLTAADGNWEVYVRWRAGTR